VTVSPPDQRGRAQILQCTLGVSLWIRALTWRPWLLDPRHGRADLKNLSTRLRCWQFVEATSSDDGRFHDSLEKLVSHRSGIVLSREERERRPSTNPDMPFLAC